MPDPKELFDAEFLGKLRSLFLKLRKRRKLKRKGAQASPVAGTSREFKDHRRYVPGDDFRTIDWRLYARLEKMFIRLFEEIQEFHIHILLDRSVSMTEPYGAKRMIALRLAAALAYLGLVNTHRVSVMSLSESVRREMPPLKGQGHIHAILKHLAALEFNGVTNLVESLRIFRPGRDRRGIVFLISDLFGRAPGDSTRALEHVAAWPSETHVIHVLDPLEMRPALEGELRLIDVETNEVRRMWLTRRDTAIYRREFQKYLEDLERSCMQRQVNYLGWTTDRAFEDMFLELLSRGSILAAD